MPIPTLPGAVCLPTPYTYFARGGVFANAQTGNVVLLSHHLFAGNFSAALRCLIPLISFAMGIAAAEAIRRKSRHTHLHWRQLVLVAEIGLLFGVAFLPEIPLISFAMGIAAAEAIRRKSRHTHLHWRQLVLVAEIGLLFGVAFLPENWNPAANALVSFACAMQVQTFRKVHGYAFASTMCIGNLRSGMEALCAYSQIRAPSGMEALCAYSQIRAPGALHKALHYFGIIGLFALGAGLGSRLIALWGMRTIWVSCLLLLVKGPGSEMLAFTLCRSSAYGPASGHLPFSFPFWTMHILSQYAPYAGTYPQG